MALLGLAPVAGASMGPELVAKATIRPSSLAGWGLASSRFNDMPDEAGPMDGVSYAERQLHLLRWKQKHGFTNRPIGMYDCPCIESRRATSPAIKRILQAQNSDRIELREAERSVAFSMAQRLAPEWLRRFM